ncbi:MAG: SGNH/GDSL hydrolase family protein [Sphingobacteriales bacterium]|nr:MAG: SGNH/GDSL hydrolase family protein [Sphingobacteriales bacterium]
MKKYLILSIALFTLTPFTEPEVTWVAIGDSITYLNDHPDETGKRVTKGYLTGVTERLPNLRYINQGHNGWTSGSIADSIERIGLIKADVYSVFLGTNDWWQGRPLGTIGDYKNAAGNSTVYGSFRIIVNKIRQLNPKAKIVLITPLQRNDFVYIADANNNAHGSYRRKNGQSLEEFANTVIAIGKYENVPVVDLYNEPLLRIDNLVKYKRLKDITGKYVNYTYPASIGKPFNPRTDDYPYPIASINYTYDGLHPSDKGNAVIAKKVAESFKRLGLAPRWDKFINLRKYMEPFWKADTITDESVQIIKNGKLATGKLLFNAANILSIRAADQSKNFIKGKDWSYVNGKISIPQGSSIPYLKIEDLVFSKTKPGLSMKGKKPGTYVLFNENGFFSAHQILVTYIPQKNGKWAGPRPVYAGGNLAVTTRKLSAKKAMNIIFYGNSIETGYNSSGLENIPPYMPIWPQLVTYNLRKAYGSSINYINSSVPGVMAKWGLDSAAKRVTADHPDLAIIGFGMNDGASNVPPAQYAMEIKGIIDIVKADKPEAEFILIAPMLPNPDAVQAGNQAQYKAELLKLIGPGVVVADMTGVHAELLRHKTYQDMTGNNINHPNDYLARWYAQLISGILIKQPGDKQQRHY